MVLPSPVSVQLDEDDRTMLQPDVVVCCDRDKILRSHAYGAPDMVIEILSPSTRKKDMGLKLKKYITARVREYWMVDPDKKKVVVYDLEHNELSAIYGFEDQLPVNIFAGKCQIDFSEIYSYIKFLFEKNRKNGGTQHVKHRTTRTRDPGKHRQHRKNLRSHQHQITFDRAARLSLK